MQGKESIINILVQLEKERSFAKALLVIINKSDFSIESIDIIIDSLKNEIKNIKDNSTRKLLVKSLNQIEQIKQKELLEQAKDEESLKKLEESLLEI